MNYLNNQALKSSIHQEYQHRYDLNQSKQTHALAVSGFNIPTLDLFGCLTLLLSGSGS